MSKPLNNQDRFVKIATRGNPPSTGGRVLEMYIAWLEWMVNKVTLLSKYFKRKELLRDPELQLTLHPTSIAA